MPVLKVEGAKSPPSLSRQETLKKVKKSRNFPAIAKVSKRKKHASDEEDGSGFDATSKQDIFYKNETSGSLGYVLRNLKESVSSTQSP